MGQSCKCKASASVGVSLCDYPGGTPGAGRPRQHSLAAEPCSWRQAVSWGTECSGCVPSPRSVWGCSPQSSTVGTQACAQGSKFVAMCYRVMLESWHSLQWAGALGAEGLAPTLWSFILRTPESGKISWVTYFKVEISWWEGHICWVCKSSLQGNLK